MCGKVIPTQNRIPKEHYESEVGSQSSDFQAWVRREAEVVIGRREPEAECGKSVVWEMILRAVCFKGEEAGSWERDGTPTGGPAGGLGGNDGHGGQPTPRGRRGSASTNKNRVASRTQWTKPSEQ